MRTGVPLIVDFVAKDEKTPLDFTGFELSTVGLSSDINAAKSNIFSFLEELLSLLSINIILSLSGSTVPPVKELRSIFKVFPVLDIPIPSIISPAPENCVH